MPCMMWMRRNLDVVFVAMVIVAAASCGAGSALGITESGPGGDGQRVDLLSGGRVTVTYLDLDWTIVGAGRSETLDPDAGTDDDPQTDYVHVEAEIENPMDDLGLSGLSSHRLLRLRLSDSDRLIEAEAVRDGQQDAWSFGVGPLGLAQLRWSFPLPASVDASETTIVIGSNEDRKHDIPLVGSVKPDPFAEVTLSPKSFGGEYSFNSVDFVITRAFADYNAGVYDNGVARPAGDWNVDRRADEGLVFLHVDLQATESSTSPVGGVNPGRHVVVTDGGIETLCTTDAPGLYGGETVTYSATCPVPVSAARVVFQMHSGKCAGGCESLDHEIEVDSSFLAAFS